MLLLLLTALFRLGFTGVGAGVGVRDGAAGTTGPSITGKSHGATLWLPKLLLLLLPLALAGEVADGISGSAAVSVMSAIKVRSAPCIDAPAMVTRVMLAATGGDGIVM